MENPDIIIKYLDDVYIKIECANQGIQFELHSHFSFRVDNAHFHPKVKMGIWDGYIRLYNLRTSTLYCGLLPAFYSFAKQYNYKIKNEIPNDKIELSRCDVVDYLQENLKPQFRGETLKPYDYQIDAIHKIITNKRLTLLSPTSSGKSLIIYSILRMFHDFFDKKKKSLLIVPNVMLVEQMFTDFEEYSKNMEWDTNSNVHKIYSGQDKNTDKPIVISTWQSLYKLPKKYFDQFDSVIVDECHSVKNAKCLSTILEKMTNCPYKIGTTGTIDGIKINKLTLEGLFGPIYSTITTKQLMDDNKVAKLKIKSIQLLYNDDVRKNIKKCSYQQEIDYICANKKRNRFITNLAKSTKGNTLVLFTLIDKHGKLLIDDMKSQITDKPIYFIHGKTNVEDREKIRQIVEKEENSIIVASYGTMSTGVSIKNIHNIVFASPYKSRIKILQSIGRGLRLSKTKSSVILFDIFDDFKWKNYQNYTLKHAISRLKLYVEEEFDYKIHKYRVN